MHQVIKSSWNAGAHPAETKSRGIANEARPIEAMAVRSRWNRGARSLTACLIAVLAVAASASAQTTLSGLDGLSAVYGTPTAVSNGGSAVAGFGYPGPGPLEHAFRWTSGGGTEDLGFLPEPGANDYSTIPYGISADGSVVAGVSTAIFGLDGCLRAFRWTASGGMQQLGANGGRASGISADGSTVVGYGVEPMVASGACRWTSDNTLQLLGSSQSAAIACNSDGSAVVINDYVLNDDAHHVLLWSNGSSADLGVPVGWVAYIWATAMASDGSAVAGYGFTAAGKNGAFRWTAAGGMQDLGVIPGDVAAQALGISGDGSVVVGYSYGYGYQRAFLWTPWLGMVDLYDYLSAQGVDVTGWPVLQAATAISPDGSAIVGTYGSPYYPQAWIVRDLFPTPWTNLAHGLAGENGQPKLVGDGSLTAGSTGSLTLTNAHPSSLAALFVSFASTPTPFKSGLLVPVPAALTLLTATDGAGSIVLSWGAWPAGIPDGTPLYFQYAIQDPMALNGVALSNAIVGLTP